MIISYGIQSVVDSDHGNMHWENVKQTAYSDFFCLAASSREGNGSRQKQTAVHPYSALL